MKKSWQLGHSGQSLVQVLVSMGIMAIIMSTFASMMVSQQRQTRALSEKLATLDLEKLLIASLADGSVCTGELSNPDLNASAPFVFNAEPGNLPKVELPLNAIHASSKVGSPVLFEPGGLVSGASNNVKIKDISVRNFTASGSPDKYYAEFNINFDESTLSLPLKPVAIKVGIITDSTAPINAKKIKGCLGSNGVGEDDDDDDIGEGGFPPDKHLTKTCTSTPYTDGAGKSVVWTRTCEAKTDSSGFAMTRYYATNTPYGSIHETGWVPSTYVTAENSEWTAIRKDGMYCGPCEPEKATPW